MDKHLQKCSKGKLLKVSFSTYNSDVAINEGSSNTVNALKKGMLFQLLERLIFCILQEQICFCNSSLNTYAKSKVLTSNKCSANLYLFQV